MRSCGPQGLMIISPTIVLLTLGLWAHVLWKLKCGVPRVRAKGHITRYRQWLDGWCQAGEQDCDIQVGVRRRAGQRVPLRQTGGPEGDLLFFNQMVGWPAAPSYYSAAASQHSLTHSPTRAYIPIGVSLRSERKEGHALLLHKPYIERPLCTCRRSASFQGQACSWCGPRVSRPAGRL